MTLEEAAEDLQVHPGDYNIGFMGDDETQFTACSLQDLKECWEVFCADEGISEDCVDYVVAA